MLAIPPPNTRTPVCPAAGRRRFSDAIDRDLNGTLFGPIGTFWDLVGTLSGPLRDPLWTSLGPPFLHPRNAQASPSAIFTIRPIRLRAIFRRHTIRLTRAINASLGVYPLHAIIAVLAPSPSLFA